MTPNQGEKRGVTWLFSRMRFVIITREPRPSSAVNGAAILRPAVIYALSPRGGFRSGSWGRSRVDPQVGPGADPGAVPRPARERMDTALGRNRGGSKCKSMTGSRGRPMEGSRGADGLTLLPSIRCRFSLFSRRSNFTRSDSHANQHVSRGRIRIDRVIFFGGREGSLNHLSKFDLTGHEFTGEKRDISNRGR